MPSHVSPNVPKQLLSVSSCLWQSYYPDEEPGHGQWWSGAVIMDQASFLDEVEAAAQSAAGPWASEVNWERFTIHWDEPPVRAQSCPILRSCMPPLPLNLCAGFHGIWTGC